MAQKKGQTTVSIYPDWCKGCGICAAFCPTKVMVIDPTGKAVVVREEECINCGFCELHCPDFAIVVTPKEGAEISNSSPQAAETPAEPEQSDS